MAFFEGEIVPNWKPGPLQPSPFQNVVGLAEVDGSYKTAVW